MEEEMVLLSSSFHGSLFLIALVFLSSSPPTEGGGTATGSSLSSPPLPSSVCRAASRHRCYNKQESTRLKIIAIFAILATSMIGVCLPLFTRSIPAVHPDRDLFSVVKSFASGVILATGYMHVLPDSFDDLRSPCLPRRPWHKFPFTTFVAMLSAVVTLMVDSFVMSMFKRRNELADLKLSTTMEKGASNGDLEKPVGYHDDEQSALLRHRVVAQVLELGIVVHSVVIGLSMGASMNPCTIRPLVAAICFHQLFEGMGLGGCILQADYKRRMKATLVFFFSITTPSGIALGMGLSKVYRDNSPTSLIVEGLLNASSAGLLNYMALVELLAADFMGPKLQDRPKLQMWAYLAVLLGAGGMSVMAIWA
ncbi:Fe(2+) transport protein 1 [Asimina triloba]